MLDPSQRLKRPRSKRRAACGGMRLADGRPLHQASREQANKRRCLAAPPNSVSTEHSAVSAKHHSAMGSLCTGKASCSDALVRCRGLWFASSLQLRPRHHARPARQARSVSSKRGQKCCIISNGIQKRARVMRLIQDRSSWPRVPSRLLGHPTAAGRLRCGWHTRPLP